MENEVWLSIKDCPNYEISNLGSFRHKKNGIRKLYNEKSGYNSCTVGVSGKCKALKIHRLVAESFIPNPENKICVNHINGIKTDNNIENLEWCTYSENIRHAYDTGLNKMTKARVINSTAANSKKVIDTHTGIIYYSAREAARQLNINSSTLYSMLSGQNKNKTNLMYYK